MMRLQKEEKLAYLEYRLSESGHFFFFLFWLHHTACGILVPWPGIEPVPHAVEVQHPNHWTAREVPESGHL